MYQKVLLFIRYNNAFAIAFVLLFSGVGITYAASPEVRDAVYTSTETVVSVDNQQILSTDLDNFNFNLRINAVTEDDKNYYAAYSYQTLAIVDSVWQITMIEKALTVNKEALDGKDFGLYATKELAENVNYELSYLKRVQKLEIEKGASQKVVTTEYSGLVGKLLNPKEEVIEGYNPVIPEPVPEPEVPVTETPNPEPAIVPVANVEPAQTPQTSEEIGTPAESVGAESVVPSASEPIPEPVATSTPASEPTPEPVATSTPASEPTPETVSTSTPVSESMSDATSTPPSDI